MFAAKDIMTREVIFVHKNAPVYEAMEIMLKHKVSGIPVVEEDMTLVGILSEKDLVSLLYDTGEAKAKKVRHFMTERTLAFDEEERSSSSSLEKPSLTTFPSPTAAGGSSTTAREINETISSQGFNSA